ncbi:hypothetical protein VPHK250G1_0053 [Vibrio phage K250 g1]
MVSGWASALTLSPMRVDSLVYQDLHIARFLLENTSRNVTYYDVWISTREDLSPNKGMYRGEEVLGGDDYRPITVPIDHIEADKLGVYYVCVQERQESNGIGAVGRVCAKLRLYWPRAELHKLQ